MQEANEMRNQLIHEFTEKYMEKLFYFCLKKTGSHTEAEELTQDIAFEIVKALNKGTVPVRFSAWVWQIARNRYAAWAKKKRRRNERAAGADTHGEEIEDKSVNILDDIMHAEQMALLRRELAFIRNDYRNIVVAYYIENKSVRDIASSLSLSTSAVHQRLHRARIVLKEGMDMAREFGKLSYNPENISFINNGCQGNNGEPWNYITRSLCKNILLAAYRTPATAEELAMEVGVALPYMEEELSSLVGATLMRKNGNKYETNFFIVSAKAQEKIFAHLRGLAPELTRAVIAALEYELQWKNQNCPGWHEGYQPLEEMKWALLMKETDTINSYTLKPFNKDAADMPNIGPWGHTLRPNGGEWDILGMESHCGDEPGFVGLSGCVSGPNEKDLPEILFRQYRFQYGGLAERTPPVLSYADGQGMAAIAQGKGGEIDEAVLKRLESYGYIQKTDKGFVPTMMVMRAEKSRKMPEDIQEQLEALRYQARDIATRHYLFCREQIYREIPDFLKEDAFQIDHACANVFAMRGAVLEEAIQQGYLSLDNNNDRQVLGAYLVI
ncbi:MAG: sigma-70 family RNA polymerase sigma factor [Christensenellales bacterium]|jgi:RNA polymerase sigma factor (sigma-70 family)